MRWDFSSICRPLGLFAAAPRSRTAGIRVVPPFFLALPAHLLVLALFSSDLRAGVTDPPSADAASAPVATNTSLVVIVHDPLATDAFRPRADRLGPMVTRGLLAVTGRATPTQAWASLLSVKDIVGIKVNSSAGLAGTRPELVAALVESLKDFGLPPGHIVIWDKLTSDLEASGYVELGRQAGVEVASSLLSKWDETVAYTNSALGRIAWTDVEFDRTGDGVGKRSFFSRLLTRRLTKVINVTSMLNHYSAGVSGSLFSLAVGSVDNTHRFENNPEKCADAIPEIYAQEPVVDKTVLHVVDALIAQFHGEITPMLHYARAMNEVRFSRDPVAMDVLSLQTLDTLRQGSAVLYPTNAAPYIHRLYHENAPALELGIADTNRIRVERR